jgi:hypothetical protein
MNILEKLFGRPRVIYDREGGSPYLSRWYLLGSVFDDTGKRVARSRLPFSLFLHKFHRSDDDGALHSHPWRWSVAFILRGGYSEERRVGDRVVRRVKLPFQLNLIRGTDFHRVDLLGESCWTLFLAGPKASSWYFWDRFTKKRAGWREFKAEKRGLVADAGWQDDQREGDR